MSTIIVTADDSPGAVDAVELTRTLATAVGARVIVAGVHPVRAPIGAGGRAYLDIARAESASALEWAIQTLENDVTTEPRLLAADDAADALAELAAESGADLIVLGPKRSAHAGRVAAGHLALRLLHIAPCAVAVAPAGYSRHEGKAIERIGVGHNSSVEADAALDFALRLAADTGGTVDIWHVAERSVVSEVGMWATARATSTEWAQKDVHDLLRHLPAGIEARATVLNGDTADALAAQSETVDLLVLGSRGYGPVGRVLVGSVAAHVLSRARCAVIVVPRAVRPRLLEEAMSRAGAVR